MEWLLAYLPLKTVGAYLGTLALGYLVGWYRTSTTAQAVVTALSDGKIDEAEAGAALSFVKTLLGKLKK
jgi:hypothetical protein